LVGNIKTNELLAIKKISFRGIIRKKINFLIPKDIDDESVQLILMSDSYIGIDQQYSIKLESMNIAICKKYNINFKDYKNSLDESKFNIIDSSEDEKGEKNDFENDSDNEESIDDICFD
jgi:hypothetical protein